jgi:hypothetical protein
MSEPTDTKGPTEAADETPKTPRCPKYVETPRNCAPPRIPPGHPEWEEWSMTFFAPCELLEGHEGPCYNPRPDEGWQEYALLARLADEEDHPQQ